MWWMRFNLISNKNSIDGANRGLARMKSVRNRRLGLNFTNRSLQLCVVLAVQQKGNVCDEQI